MAIRSAGPDKAKGGRVRRSINSVQRTAFSKESTFIRKIESNQIAEILFGSGVIGAGGVDFIGEGTEADFFAVISDICVEAAGFFTQGDADVGRGGIFSFSSVTHIFGLSDVAHIGHSVVEGVVIAMVNDEVVGGLHNFSVHINDSGVEVGGDFGSCGVKA